MQLVDAVQGFVFDIVFGLFPNFLGLVFGVVFAFVGLIFGWPTG